MAHESDPITMQLERRKLFCFFLAGGEQPASVADNDPSFMDILLCRKRDRTVVPAARSWLQTELALAV